MRYRLRTLLIVLAVGPPVLAAGWLGFLQYREHLREREAARHYHQAEQELPPDSPQLAPQPIGSAQPAPEPH
jgi:hypothetical protein